jgi:hypothetical protein
VPHPRKKVTELNAARKRTIGAVAAGLVTIGCVGGAALSPASGAARAHTLRFDAIMTAGHNTSRTTFVSTDVDKHNGKIIGYDAVSGRFNTHTHVVSLFVALSLKGGQLFVRGSETENGHFTGKVTGGAGAYQGARGTVTGHQVTDNKTAIVVKYRL